MELTLQLNHEQIIQLLKQLPFEEKRLITIELTRELALKKSEAEQDKNLSQFQELLLHGPVMSDEQFQEFQAFRKQFNLWRTHSSV